MMKIKCDKCGEIMTKDNAFCLNCGHQLTESFKTIPLFGNKPEEKTDKYPDQKEKIDYSIRKSNFDYPKIFAFLRSRTVYILAATIVIHLIGFFLLPSLFAFFKKEDQPVSYESTEFIIYLLQAAMCGIFILLFFTHPHNKRYSLNEIAYKSYNQFLKNWGLLCITWVFLYGYMSFLMAVVILNTPDTVLKITVDFLNILNAFNFFYLFLVFDIPSVNTTDEQNRNANFRKMVSNVKWIYIGVFLLAIISRVLTVATDLRYKDFGVYLSGSLVAISMCYFFGRFDSHYIGVSRMSLAPFYFYGVIQIIGPFLLGTSDSYNVRYKIPFFVLVLLLKFYLFFTIYRWVNNGVLEKYFDKGVDQMEKEEVES